MPLRQYVEFGFSGLLFTENSVQPYEGGPVEIPAHSFGYRTFWQREVVEEAETLYGKPQQHSPWTYLGERLTLEDVKRDHPEKTTLIANMEGNGYASVVHTPDGRFYPLNEGDTVMSAPHARAPGEEA
jgi:hypothetical protein